MLGLHLAMTLGNPTLNAGVGVPAGYLALRYNSGGGVYLPLRYKDANGVYRLLAYKVA